MKHLSEEQFIDVLMEESHSKASMEHLSECQPCADRLLTLKRGLSAARAVQPRMPLTAVPVLSYDKFAKQRKSVRHTWLAVAAMLLLAVTGFRMEIGKQGVTLQFALFKESTQPAQTISELEQRLASEFMDALNLQAVRMQNQLDTRLDTFYLDNDQEMGEFSQVVNRNLTHYNLEQERKMAEIEKHLLKQRKNNKGQWR